jgi:hypothetical protein
MKRARLAPASKLAGHLQVLDALFEHAHMAAARSADTLMEDEQLASIVAESESAEVKEGFRALKNPLMLISFANARLPAPYIEAAIVRALRAGEIDVGKIPLSSWPNVCNNLYHMHCYALLDALALSRSLPCPTILWSDECKDLTRERLMFLDRAFPRENYLITVTVDKKKSVLRDNIKALAAAIQYHVPSATRWITTSNVQASNPSSFTFFYDKITLRVTQIAKIQVYITAVLAAIHRNSEFLAAVAPKLKTFATTSLLAQAFKIRNTCKHNDCPLQPTFDAFVFDETTDALLPAYTVLASEYAAATLALVPEYLRVATATELLYAVTRRPNQRSSLFAALRLSPTDQRIFDMAACFAELNLEPEQCAAAARRRFAEPGAAFATLFLQNQVVDCLRTFEFASMAWTRATIAALNDDEYFHYAGDGILEVLDAAGVDFAAFPRFVRNAVLSSDDNAEFYFAVDCTARFERLFVHIAETVTAPATIAKARAIAQRYGIRLPPQTVAWAWKQREFQVFLIEQRYPMDLTTVVSVAYAKTLSSTVHRLRTYALECVPKQRTIAMVHAVVDACRITSVVDAYADYYMAYALGAGPQLNLADELKYASGFRCKCITDALKRRFIAPIRIGSGDGGGEE